MKPSERAKMIVQLTERAIKLLAYQKFEDAVDTIGVIKSHAEALAKEFSE